MVYGPCRCEAGSDLFLVKRKFDPAHFNVASKVFSLLPTQVPDRLLKVCG